MKLTEQDRNAIRQIAIKRINLDEGHGEKLVLAKIGDYIQRALDFSGVEYDKEDFDNIFQAIEREFQVEHTLGACIFDEEPKKWYSNDTIEDNFFWERYKRYLSEGTTIDAKSIKKLETETLPDIMNCLGNPKEELSKKRLRRGLIIGDVQSGKTATYTGLICKAADAGYKVVILLAGITESLRQQTQKRIDYGIVGRTVVRIDNKTTRPEIVGVGKEHQLRGATSFTSYVRDFGGDYDKISTKLNDHNSLVIFVVKKNVSVLTKLYKWLKDNNVDPVLGCVNHPMLLIDDEADNASVNTKKDETDPTKTNKIIRRICNLFMNSTYVGFTATPFANVFIDPDSVDAMKNADLFPEHFIYTLPIPSTYIGPKKIFYAEGIFHRNIRYITDIDEPDYESSEYKEDAKSGKLNEGPFYSRHNKEWDGILPESLRESILCYYLANAVRDLRGEKNTPRSMLVNMSRFIRVQNLICDYIHGIANNVREIIKYDFNEDSKKNKQLPLYQELEYLWHRHFGNINDVSFDQVINKKILYATIENISVIVVNGGKNSGRLDYENNPNLRVIAVGGMALSRGLTLEGLLVSYFYRNTSTFDVLMQMGRWFGYRRGYEDLFQIWTSELSASWYEEIARATEELKDDVRRMHEEDMTPKDFGIRVRDYCNELQITAANKMRQSYNLQEIDSYYGTIYGTPYINKNLSLNVHNKQQVSNLCSSLFDQGFKLQYAEIEKYKEKSIEQNNGASLFFHDVPKELIIDFIGGIKCSLSNMHFNTDNLIKFIDDDENTGLEKWDIVFEGGDGSQKYDISGLETINCVARAVFSSSFRNVVQITSRRTILGLREGMFCLQQSEILEAEELCRKDWEAKGENSKGRDIPNKAYFQFLKHRNPVLIIMLIQPRDPKEEDERKKIKDFREELGEEKLVAFAIGFPGVKHNSTKKYKVNKIYYNLYLQDAEPEEIGDEDEK